jgi:hypothetical protein
MFVELEMTCSSVSVKARFLTSHGYIICELDKDEIEHDEFCSSVCCPKNMS